MNSASEAINTLISAVNVAHTKGGVYTIEETYYIHMAMSFLERLSQTPPVTPQETQNIDSGKSEEY